MSSGNIIIVDDNKQVLTALEILLLGEFNEVVCLNTPNRIIRELEKQSYDVVLLDMNFSAGINSGNEGLFWMKEIHEKVPDLSIVLFTAYGDVDLAVKALKEGAVDFVLKPWENKKLLATLKSAAELTRSRREVRSLKNREKAIRNVFKSSEQIIIGKSPAISRMMQLIEKVAATDTNVLITGENGTGKELVAQEIHRRSLRKNEILVSVDMGAITETLFESELFGHVKGAFTDARDTRTGKFELAHNGTLFMDEIGNLSLPLQAKLLAALQNRQIVKVGSNTPADVNIRLLCATNQQIAEMVSQGTFREDLLYRINTIHIEVPPLRHRGEDILLIANHFLQHYCAKYRKDEKKLTARASRKLMEYRWPGNIRELKHSIEKAVILSDNSTIDADEFLFRITESKVRTFETMPLATMEKRLIVQAIKEHPGNITAAAEALGVTRQTLYNKMKKWDIS